MKEKQPSLERRFKLVVVRGLSNPHINEAKTPIGDNILLKKQGLYCLIVAIGTVPTHNSVASHGIRKLVLSCILSEKLGFLFLSPIT